MNTVFVRRGVIGPVILAGFLLFGTGCKNPFLPAPAPQPATPAAQQPAPAAQQATPATAPVRDDQQIGSDVQAKINAESALNGQNIQLSVANGVVTLTGKVENDASRALAAADSATVDGVKTVVNNLEVGRTTASKTAEKPVVERHHKQLAQLRRLLRHRRPHQRRRLRCRSRCRW